MASAMYASSDAWSILLMFSCFVISCIIEECGILLCAQGGLAERLKAAVLKTVKPRGFVGSNPTTSASIYAGQKLLLTCFLFTRTYELPHPSVKSPSEEGLFLLAACHLAARHLA